MQYMVSVIDDTPNSGTPEEQAAIDVFNDRLKAEGHWVFAGGLAVPSSATVIDNRGEEAIFTDVALYDQLVCLDPSPIIALNRAIAVAELDGPEVALAAVDRLEDRLAGYHLYHATRADLLRRLGRSQKSRAAYDKAIELAGNTAETAYLTRRRDQLG